jgi:hypothetical protein
MGLDMVDNEGDRRSAIALDFGRLLGFDRVSALAGDRAGSPPVPMSQLARALGATCNKIGQETTKAEG